MLHAPATDDTHDPVRLRQDRRQFWRAAGVSVGFVAALAWIKLLEWLFGQHLGALGVLPGNPWGLIGVLTGPLVHGSIEHLASNSFGLIVLGTLAIYAYPKATVRALPVIWLGSGLFTWLIGRENPHFGASGVTHGLMFFLFLLGVLRWDRRAIAVALVVFFLYGGMLLTILPREPGISWEYHLGGALMGAIAAIAWRKLDPAPPRKKYSWDYEAELAEANALSVQDEFEPPRPAEVPVLWRRPDPDAGQRVLPFRTPNHDPDLDDEPPTPTRH